MSTDAIVSSMGSVSINITLPPPFTGADDDDWGLWLERFEIATLR